MAIDWQTVITSLGQNTVMFATLAWLIKQLLSNRLARDVEQFKSELRANADIEIERVKAFLVRGSRVHESQVETLTKLDHHFLTAQSCLQRMSGSIRFQGDLSMDEYHRLLMEAIGAAQDTLSTGRLLIPHELAEQCERFFNSLLEGETHIALAQHPMIVDGFQRADFWNKAQKLAYREVPMILNQIEKAARNVIHSEFPRTGASLKT